MKENIEPASENEKKLSNLAVELLKVTDADISGIILIKGKHMSVHFGGWNNPEPEIVEAAMRRIGDELLRVAGEMKDGTGKFQELSPEQTLFVPENKEPSEDQQSSFCN